MRFQIQLLTLFDDGQEQQQEIITVERSEVTPATLGLNLNESKELLKTVQQTMASQQLEEHLENQRLCPDCGKRRHSKGKSQPTIYHTPFGKVSLPNPRWKHCPCLPRTQKTFRPLAELLPERISPELLYLESKWAGLLPYGVTTKLLHDVLPLDEKHSLQTVRNHLCQVAKRSEEALGEEKYSYIDTCQSERDKLPIPNGPLTVGLDGGYVRSCKPKNEDKAQDEAKHFMVITGKSVLAFQRDDPESTPSSKCFGFVKTYDEKPKRRLFELLKSQGMQQNQQLTFLTDGEETIRELSLFLSPEADHILDWFHITMRMTVLSNCAIGLQKVKPSAKKESGEELGEYEKRVESIKHYLWHGNVFRAFQKMESLELDLEDLVWAESDETDEVKEAATSMLKYISELRTYVVENQAFIPNYGERYRNGELISTAIAESTVNQVISKRMVKKQQMQWTPEGAHLLLQVRTAILNGELEQQFQRWYPGFCVSSEAKAA